MFAFFVYKHIIFQNTTLNIHFRGNMMEIRTNVYNTQRKELLIIGILSRSDKNCLRDAHRQTLIAQSKSHKKLDIRIYFVLDEETPELLAEQNIHRDIVFLNTSIHGWNRYFGTKLFMWMKYVVDNFPDVDLIGRMDDDVFACAPQIFDRLYHVRHDMLYYGYPTGTLENCPDQDCVDEMFLVIGKTLAQRVVNRTLCKSIEELRKHRLKQVPKCLQTFELHTGTHELRRWIKPYNDIQFVNERENSLVLWFYRGTPEGERRIFQSLRTWDFCRRFLLYHKATLFDIYKMAYQNAMQLKFGFANFDKLYEMNTKQPNCSKYNL